MASGVRADGTVSAGSRPSRVGGIRIHRLGGESLLYAPERGVAHALFILKLQIAGSCVMGVAPCGRLPRNWRGASLAMRPSWPLT